MSTLIPERRVENDPCPERRRRLVAVERLAFATDLDDADARRRIRDLFIDERDHLDEEPS